MYFNFNFFFEVHFQKILEIQEIIFQLNKQVHHVQHVQLYT